MRIVANIKSAKKRVLVNRKSQERNKSVKSDLKTAIKKAEFALENKAEDSAALVKEAVNKLDRAAGKGILHMNTVARKKSQLARKLNQQ